jgi:alpha-1,6-mannosyltransferase
VTYVGRFFGKWGRLAGQTAEKLAWLFARFNYQTFRGFMVSSEQIGLRMKHNGLHPIFSAPLGVDTELFHPSKRDALLTDKLKAGSLERLTVFFPHRFMEEKGLRTLLKAYPMICRTLEVPPALIFAGTGPDLPLVKEAAAKYPHVQYLGFVESPREMAKWYASCEVGLALSRHETFGLSILEAMASGQALIGADLGAALEHIQKSKAGLTIPGGSPEALTRALMSLSRMDRLELSRSARRYAEQYTWNRCFERELEIYEKLLCNSSRPE